MYTFKFQKAAENTPDTDTDAETQSEPPEDFNAEGRLIIYTGNKPNYPVVTAKTVYKNGAAEKTDYNVTPEVYLCGIDRYLDVEYNNRQRRVYGVTVNGERTFDNFSDAFEYIEANKTYYPEAVTVKAEITWDAEALTNPDADRTTYTFEFAVTFTDPGSETQTPESDPTFIQMKQQLIVQIEDEKYFPDIIRKTAYKNGAAKTTEYIRDDIKITWNGTDGISAVNNIYSQWHIYAVTVNGEETFDAPYKAFDYIKDKNGTYRMEIEVTWDSAAVSDPDADRTTYTYAFEVERIKN